jgi:Reverse transcriptase (RNA-dependent DNA polymerase)
LGIAAVEDKIVQQAVVTVLNQIYEVDFRGFSCGFGPGRSPHQALDALTVGIQRKKVNWVLDADIRGFFDRVNHDKLMGQIPKPLFQAPLVPFSNWRNNYFPASDGQRFLMLTPVAEAKPEPITVVVNWPALLRQSGSK